jgi:hypothetical protein
MLRFLVGVLIGVGLAAGALYYWHQAGDGCFGRCGDGTRCQAHQCRPVVVEAPKETPKPPPKRRRGTGATAEKQLRPGDDKLTSAGDALGRPEYIDFNKTGDEGRELAQDELDAAFHKAQPAILRCISEAVGDWPLESGTVSVGLRIEADGGVSRVRVQAPALLMRNGVYGCIRPAVAALRFPRSGGASVVTYPFALQ